MMTKRLMGVAEVAEYLNTTAGVIYQRVSKRTIPFVKDGRRVKFDIRQIDNLIEKNSYGVIANGEHIQKEGL